MTNLITDKFDFIASVKGWDSEEQCKVWKTIALLVIQVGSCTEEEILTFLTTIGSQRGYTTLTAFLAGPGDLVVTPYSACTYDYLIKALSKIIWGQLNSTVPFR